MFDNIKSVYGKDKNGVDHVLGMIVYDSNEDGLLVKKEFYLGWEFTLDDIVNKDVNRRNIGVKDVNAFKQQYELLNASGVVFFPQTGTYYFKEDGDVVLHWEYGMDEERILSAVVKGYCNIQNASLNRFYEAVENMDPEDPMLELYDVPTRSRKTNHSRR